MKQALRGGSFVRSASIVSVLAGGKKNSLQSVVSERARCNGSGNVYVSYSRDDRMDVRRSSQRRESVSLSEARCYHVTYFNIAFLSCR